MTFIEIEINGLKKVINTDKICMMETVNSPYDPNKMLGTRIVLEDGSSLQCDVNYYESIKGILKPIKLKSNVE